MLIKFRQTSALVMWDVSVIAVRRDIYVYTPLPAHVVFQLRPTGKWMSQSQMLYGIYHRMIQNKRGFGCHGSMPKHMSFRSVVVAEDAERLLPALLD